MTKRATKIEAIVTPPPASADLKIPSKLDRLIQHMSNPSGATIADMMTATGWQVHSVRGAMAGALKKRGHTITSEKVDGERRYRIATPL